MDDKKLQHCILKNQMEQINFQKNIEKKLNEIILRLQKLEENITEK